MQNMNVADLPSLEAEAGMLVEKRDEAVVCALTARIAAVIGAIF